MVECLSHWIIRNDTYFLKKIVRFRVSVVFHFSSTILFIQNIIFFVIFRGFCIVVYNLRLYEVLFISSSQSFYLFLFHIIHNLSLFLTLNSFVIKLQNALFWINTLFWEGLIILTFIFLVELFLEHWLMLHDNNLPFFLSFFIESTQLSVIMSLQLIHFPTIVQFPFNILDFHL